MNSLLIAFFISFFSTILVIRSKKLHAKFTYDLDLTGPQKFHQTPVPRVGGIGIALGLSSALILYPQSQSINYQDILLLLCAAPVFLIGLTEDITKKISIRWRLIFTVLGGILAAHFLQAQIVRLYLVWLE
jgi:UDP-GlcNAc:undecaprenyl-phosphate GlcNAc-1-phosphate transferase